MDKRKDTGKGLRTRRQFLKVAGVGGLSAASLYLLGCAAKETTETVTTTVTGAGVTTTVTAPGVTTTVTTGPGTGTTVTAPGVTTTVTATVAPEEITWDYEADVIVVGYGGAGSVTAITAFDAGASVLILEKQQADTPTQILHTPSSRLSFTAFQNPPNKEVAIRYFKTCSRGATPDDVIEAFAEYSPHVKEWYESMGASLYFLKTGPNEYEDKYLPGTGAIDQWAHKDRGAGLWKILSSNVESRGIDILYESPGKRLITDVDGGVIGVVVQQAGKDLNVKARKAVVLTCGGFEYDEELKNYFHWGYPTKFYSNPGNTGDGIRMACTVGAALWHMSAIGGRPEPYFPELGWTLPGGRPKPFIFVDQYGKRFMKEVAWKSHTAYAMTWQWDDERAWFPAVPCFSIFDHSALAAGPIVSTIHGMLTTGQYTWSEDNSEEVQKGWILKGDTIEELAGVITQDPEAQFPNGVGKMPPDVLADTIRQYNEYCENGDDPDFGRLPSSLLKIEEPPFHALKCYPGGVNTFGGPKRNAKGQIVNALGEPIPRLYSAGELGSVLGFLYESGWNVAELVVSGQIAGKSVAALDTWD